MPTVVLGDDQSKSSDLALAWIENQRWPGWRLEVVHAVTPPIGPPLPPEETELHEWQPAEPRTVTDRAELAGVVHLTAAGDPRLILSRSVDLLVIGPRGRGVLKSLHLGSVAEWLVTHPTSPTVLVRAGHKVGKVLISHDGSQSASLAVRSFAALPWAAGTERAVVVVDDGRVDVDRAVTDARAAFGEAGADLTAEVLEGVTTPAIAGAIDRAKPDLVVMGTRGLTGFRRFHLGSTASAIARSAPCSILLACADGAEPDV